MFLDRQTQKAAGRPDGSAASPDGADVDPRWAWTPYKPNAQQPWNLRGAGHLYRRAAFGASWKQLRQALDDGPQRSVDKLMRPKDDVATTSGRIAAFNQSLDEYENAAGGSGGTETLRAWWLRRMIQTPHPLLEKMTLFWHSHFGISNARVNNAALMARHVQMLRSHALGLYRPLLEAVSSDPAVFLGLGAETNRKAVPSANFARQLMESFSLGPGHYGEEDVREASRAFTGWFVLRGRLRFFPAEHDSGVKKVLGREGAWNVEDVVRIVLDQPAVPKLLVRKLYRWLISEVSQPSDALLAPLTRALAKDYNVGRVVETMLRSNLFFSRVAYRRRIKSPVEFAVGIIRSLEGMVSTVRLGTDLAELGQNLYQPPTASGWQGGRSWINAAMLVGRSNLARDLLASQGPYGGKLDPMAIAKKYDRSTLEASAKLLIDLFLQDDISEETRRSLSKALASAQGGALSQQLREFAHRVVTLPEFHLC